MDHSKNILVFLIIIISLLRFSYVVSAKQKILLLPNSIENIYLGMEYSEFKKICPKAKKISKEINNRMVIINFFENDDLWDSAMFIFINKKLSSLTLLHGVYKKTRYKDTAQKALSHLMKTYGKDFKKTVIKGNHDHDLRPLLIWEQREFIVYFTYSFETMVDNKKIIPFVQVQYTLPDRPTSEFFKKVSIDQNHIKFVNFFTEILP